MSVTDTDIEELCTPRRNSTSSYMTEAMSDSDPGMDARRNITTRYKLIPVWDEGPSVRDPTPPSLDGS